MTDQRVHSRRARRSTLALIGAFTALYLVLAGPVSAEAASKSWINGYIERSTWWRYNAVTSTKVNVYGTDMRVGTVKVRINNSVSTSPAGSIVVTYKKKSLPTIDCEWTTPTTWGNSLPMRCINYS